jgi:hypothetical protein
MQMGRSSTGSFFVFQAPVSDAQKNNTFGQTPVAALFQGSN